ncbi:TetR/AcrR family transcriptional regulator [Sinomicrobium weinanense]|uniref:TetR/AcrR family transcriptional regulator n=1 Tax=Sinomicrobium weinanense TaxID=2842200 RepID=A0A926Q227_9FLAO|nr:TetR/AcrR family transcriptional regulator [Sinomicrobium weinanense]MBC9794486.1 TetR/AcrR family transcriptional regulator [Sinomicrobium weinanense]MBU3124393.1 TetR/AcrR family transcriptional regulator [Sinomicrobium weinanense]
MITKEEFLKLSITNFTRFGSRNFTMDQLAAELGISKRTIYQHFANKQELVLTSFQYLLNTIKREMTCIEQKQKGNPLPCIIYFYKLGLEKLQSFNPSFLHGLRKYYPEAYLKFEDFKNDVVYGKVYHFLKTAQELKQLRKDIDLGLVCKLYLLRMDEIVFTGNLFEDYSKEVLLEHLITNNLRGLMTPEYVEKYNFSL